jgi:NADH dehydrogenase FAD-containing subunit
MMSRFRVVICGGGIAAMEALLRLRSLAGEKGDVTLVAPEEELRYHPTAVDQPFTVNNLLAYPLETIAGHTDTTWVQDAAELIDPDDQVVRTAGGQKFSFDACSSRSARGRSRCWCPRARPGCCRRTSWRG